jgi:hypothetical protein
MQTERLVFEKLFTPDKVELKSQRYEFAILDDLKAEWKQKQLNGDSAQLTEMRNKYITGQVVIGSIINRLKPIEDAAKVLGDNAMISDIGKFKVNLDLQGKRYNKLEKILNDAAKA